MKFKFFALTDVGRVRNNNEDAVTFDESHGVAVLADGMGGYNAGEVASGMATVFMKSELVRWLSAGAQNADPAHIGKAIDICAHKVNQSILQAAVSNPQYTGMGTTLVVGVFQADRVTLGHVGDSRCYRFRSGELVQLTKDHSMLQEQVDAGLLTLEQAAVAPGKNLLTRALGSEEALQLDVNTYPVLAEDIYLMCSDGLTDMLDNADIAHVLKTGATLETTGAELVAQANAKGGRDNIAVLLTKVLPADVPAGLMSSLFGRAKHPTK
ncbi:Stp1/IreP family PP2C-type Ser/Thr phosphatase [Rhodoferax sp.]|uniref:Stp1/IreP family PP2C-type Ser/Thr phosphatase n=1 Tax=Rhodoferax sp. TaxID=50421 RepID=UPI002636C103|nr:Stp1/IreP family PP2C-type Ser/Thr phosphatase [Rhodoferax sp.]MDD2810560.1 Stp1/IreP family PP2C-type Ser/Thr phosphatase [Rhodoferax sp.]